MPKANKVGKSRINAKSDKPNDSSKTTDDVPTLISKTQQLSRGQKKKLAKRQQYEARMVSHAQLVPISQALYHKPPANPLQTPFK